MRAARSRCSSPTSCCSTCSCPTAAAWSLLRRPGADRQSEVVLITGHASLETSIQALRLGAADYLDQAGQPQAAAGHPVARDAAVGAEGRAADDLNEELEAQRPLRPPVGPLGADAARLRADRARRGTAVTVFITGESGTGKELVARTVHDLSRRRSRPFLAVNCGAISPQPDRERAVRPREGQLHRRRAPAPGLLRARARRHAVPRRDHRDAARAAGQAAARARDRHASCASARPSVQRDRRARHRRHQPRPGRRRSPTGKLREDLLYRLNVFPIELPPLRERADDIPLLARALPGRRSASARARTKRFTRGGAASAAPHTAGPATCASCATSCSAPT